METRDLAADPAHFGTLTEFRRRTDQLRAQYAGPYVPIEPAR